MTYPYGVQIAQVNVDPGTGAVRVEKVLIAFDVGRAINPMLVRGQLVGGFAQGLGECPVRGVSRRRSRPTPFRYLRRPFDPDSKRSTRGRCADN